MYICVYIYIYSFSDRCAGQNQNRTMFVMLPNALSSFKIRK